MLEYHVIHLHIGYNQQLVNRVVPFSTKICSGYNTDIRFYHKWEGGIENPSQITIWHYEACGEMTNGDPEGLIFYPTLAQIMDSFSCLPLDFWLNISLQKSLNMLRCYVTLTLH